MSGADSSLLFTSTRIYESNGNGTFNEIAASLPGLYNGDIAVADFDEDGFIDFVVAGWDSTLNDTVLLFKNTGDFDFSPVASPLISFHEGELAFGDYNGDTLPDLLTSGWEYSGFETHVYTNNGNGTFQLLLSFPSFSGTADWVDYDQDGDLDFLITGHDSTLTEYSQLYRNDGNGIFLFAESNLPGFGDPSGVGVADFDLNGYPDFSFIGKSQLQDHSALALNDNGDSTFNIIDFFPGSQVNAINEPADIDKDGDMDLLFNNVLLRNNTQTTGTGDLENYFMNVFPNPATDFVIVENPEAHGVLEVRNQFGECVYRKDITQKVEQIKISSFPSGVYYIHVTDGTSKRIAAATISKQ